MSRPARWCMLCRGQFCQGWRVGVGSGVASRVALRQVWRGSVRKGKSGVRLVMAGSVYLAWARFGELRKEETQWFINGNPLAV